MWSLDEYKRVFYAVGLVGIIICLTPSAVYLLNSQPGEQFSELYILGPGHMAENYPFNVSAGHSYMVYLGVGNHMGSSVYYGVEVKFRNASEPLPDNTVASSLPALYEYRVFLGDSQVWEGALTFSFSDVVFDGSTCSIGKVQVNSVEFQLGKFATWDNESSGFYYELFVELYRFTAAANGRSEFDGRFVGLWLNMTSGV